MNDLYDRIVNADEDEDFAAVFSSLNLKGWKPLNDIGENVLYRNKVVRYIAYAYSYQSRMLRASKDRWEVKKKIAEKVGIDTDDFGVLKNQDLNVNAFIKWYLDENEHPLWAAYISGKDFVADQLMLVREGLFVQYTGDNEKEMAKFIKNVKKDSELRSKAYFNARKAIEQLNQDERELEKAHEYLEGIVKKEVPEFFEGNLNWAEYQAHKLKKQNESNKKQSHPALS